jgi:hypothetical protein
MKSCNNVNFSSDILIEYLGYCSSGIVVYNNIVM